MYRVSRLLANLSLVAFDLGSSAILLWQKGATAAAKRPGGLLNSKSTQPRLARRWDTLYHYALTHFNRVPVVKFVRGRWRGNVDADVKVVAAVTGSRRALPFELRLIEREFDTMKSLAHPNIVQGSNQQS